MNPKQVLIIRKDLTMRKGKIAAQCAHASMAVLLDMMVYDLGRVASDPNDIMEGSYDFVSMTLEVRRDTPLFHWLTEPSRNPDVTGVGFKKVCVYVNSEEELLDAYDKAVAMDIPCALITDSGATEFKGVATNTVVAIGPDLPERIDEITGNMKLL